MQTKNQKSSKKLVPKIKNYTIKEKVSKGKGRKSKSKSKNQKIHRSKKKFLKAE